MGVSRERLRKSELKERSKSMNDELLKAINEWMKRCEAISIHYKLQISQGKSKKYIKIEHTDKEYGGQVSVYAFIEIATGDVFLPASWRVPAKHPRGNIYQVGNEGAGKWGINYLR